MVLSGHHYIHSPQRTVQYLLDFFRQLLFIPRFLLHKSVCKLPIILCVSLSRKKDKFKNADSKNKNDWRSYANDFESPLSLSLSLCVRLRSAIKPWGFEGCYWAAVSFMRLLSLWTFYISSINCLLRCMLMQTGLNQAEPLGVQEMLTTWWIEQCHGHGSMHNDHSVILSYIVQSPNRRR